jgi:hypothetical protein
MVTDRPKVPFTGLQTAIAAYKTAVTVQSMSTNDTVTLTDFTTITTAIGFRDDTGATVTFTISTNVITLTTAALTNVPVSIMAWGVK